MMVKFFSVLLCLILLFSCCGCTLKESGADLYAFCERMNERNESYDLSPSGYIVNENDYTFTKFFQFTKNEVMTQFEYNDENQLVALHIVFDGLGENDTSEFDFVKDAVFSFINNDTTASDLLTQIQFDTTVFIKDINSKKAKIGNTEMIIDVTDMGTVISVYQNIP